MKQLSDNELEEMLYAYYKNKDEEVPQSTIDVIENTLKKENSSKK